MQDDGAGRPSADREALIRAAIGSWRDGLVGLTRANRLLNFRPSRTGTIGLVRPSPADILSRLRMGGTYTFRSLAPEPGAAGYGGPATGQNGWAVGGPPTVPPTAADILDTDAGPDDLAAALRALMRRSNQDYLDRGLRVLYLAFGALTWADEDQARYTSPLLLVPARLVAAAPRQPPVLEATADDPVINPALRRNLSTRGITLPPADELAELPLDRFLAAVRDAVAGRDGWHVSEGAVLSCFSFAKEAVYRDLLDHEDLAAAHPAVRALAAGGPGGAGHGLLFDGIPEQEIDRRAAPETTPVVLDADASQRAAIAAALDGRSFVLDGPPGTGKSQTIANMIGALLHAGKTVLFVSEKAAALDVVRDRLAGAGLGAYLLELHSHQATRKQVAASLAKALDTVPVAPPPMSPMDLDTARKRREQLSAYAGAMNRTRDPLGYSLHEIIGLIANESAVPDVPATGRAPVGDLTVEAFSEVRRTAAALAASWRPATQGRSFVWRGVTARGSLDARVYQAASALEALAGMTKLNQPLADVTGLTRPSDAAALAGLLSHLLAWPPGMPDDWLTAGAFEPVEAGVAQLAATLGEIAAGEDQASRAAGAPWSAIPHSGMLPPVDGGALAGLAPPCADPGGLTAEQISGLSQAFAADADMLQERLGTLSGLASMLGLRPPVTFGDAADLLAVADLGGESDRPEHGWLSVPGYQAASEAGRALYDAHRALARAAADAGAYYTPEVLQHDVYGLVRRFSGEHQGLGKLSTDYRADKRAVAAFTREEVARETAYQQLPLAAAWQSAAQALAAAEADYAPLLGRYYAGAATDFDRLGRALTHAADAVHRAHGQDLRQAAGHIGADAQPNPAVTAIAAEARQALSAWQGSLAPRPATTGRPELLNGSIADAATWLRAHLGPLHAAGAFTRRMSEVAGRPLTFSQARHLVALREAAEAAHQRLAAQDAAFRDLCGDLYAGDETDVTALRTALDWAWRLRTMITGGTGPLTPAHLKAAESAVPMPGLPAADEEWRQARDALMAAFDPDRRADLVAELDDYDETADLLTVMFDDSGGRDEWHTYQAARASLAAHGLGVAVDFCIAGHVEPAQVPEVIERALLREWIEYHIRTDPALATVRAADRDALVGEYQELDRALISAAAGEVIRACNARRPHGDAGEPAIIHREAEKKTGHMPVRALIERTPQACQAVKPCFMMSPVTVSQHLPAGLRFDVVIVDEASQVSPADAIGCIYRGGALILAGDQRQLPPTSFPGSAGRDEWPEEPGDAADPESVLDLAKRSGAYRSLALRCHYRSRHEALIAFSNAAFYEGRLITFPRRNSDGPNVGVELFWDEGTYRRGTSRDNPDEAARVAERVIHHYDTRPDLSLGVVAFSEAQAAAIEAAVGRARQRRPDLDRLFTDDRLRGFFVKNPETVQGDERDVLILSIGYGPDENRQLTMNFGPLSGPGGWRRLNVAVTRARYRTEIVSSIRAGDIPESVTSEGLRHLRRYLDYATSGPPALAPGSRAGSPFAESVMNVIRSWGYALTPQVGTGYRIDIGIHYPSHPGVYALGVECDGHQYHSAKAARDRDRLREQVLRDLGWNLHRIWGASWHLDRKGEERRLQAAIEHAMAAPVHGPPGGAGMPPESARPAVQTEAAALAEIPGWATPYVTAAVPALPDWADPADPGSQFTMTDGVRAVVGVEAPVHIGVLYERLSTGWHIGRIGTRIRDNMDAAVRLADVIQDGEFLTLADAPPPTVRTPVPACERTVDQVHDDELALALVSFVRDSGGIGRGELTARIARLYGWAERGPDITGRMGALIARLRRTGVLAGDEQAVTAAPAEEQQDAGRDNGVAVTAQATGWSADPHDRAAP